MTKHEKHERYKENLKKDPIRYATFLERRRKDKKKYHDKLRSDPNRYSAYLKKQEGYRRKRGVRKRVLLWKGETKYERYFKHRPFRKMAKFANKRCKSGKTTALELWSLAKKQKLICALTGDKLTTENVSLDHIIPQSKGGTNDITNLQLVTHHANTIKNDMSMNEFYLFCKKVANTIKDEEIVNRQSDHVETF